MMAITTMTTTTPTATPIMRPRLLSSSPPSLSPARREVDQHVTIYGISPLLRPAVANFVIMLGIKSNILV